ncbi:MAG: T9SS type B sorting domain-containing protein [Pedobacter sp.]|nr:MAG: T9SS type B sorting domain-containing protein [Pedobacter sp.]
MQWKRIRFYLFFIFLSAQAASSFSQSISNEGMEFWTVFPTHDPSGQGSNFLATMNINVTSRSNTEVTVSCGGISQTQRVAANTVVTFLVDRSRSYIPYEEGNKNLVNRGIHISVTPGMPKIVAYSHVFASARSAATLILPIESLGQKYFSMNYTQDGQGQNFLTLVAVEDETELVLHKTDGSTQSIKLDKAGDVYHHLSTSKEDFTGTLVEVSENSSCKRFAAFSGTSSVTIGCSGSRDPLLQQLYAVNSWGKHYGVVPFRNRNYLIRVLSQEDNTVVKMDGRTVATLQRGLYYESSVMNGASIVSSDKLISVAQYSLTQDCSSATPGVRTIGDPEMVLLNPVEFNIKNVTVFSSNKNMIQEKYINVFMKTKSTASFRINGLSPNAAWEPIPSDSLYSYIQMQVFEDGLTLTAEDGFNALAYGFGTAESYAYSAGTNLFSSSTISLVNLQSGLNSSSSACLGQATNLSLTVPYRLTRITWNFNDGTQSFVDSRLATPIRSTDNMGNELFTYISPTGKLFETPGRQIVTAKAILLPQDAPPCFDGTDLDFNFEIDVVPLGRANFDIPEICAGTPIQFFDKSSITGNTIAQWKWDFDGVVYTDKNPIHTFESKGVYNVTLSVANAAGCWSDVIRQSLSVTKDFPRLEFNALNPVCVKDQAFQLIASEKLGLSSSSKIFKGKGVSLTGIFDPQSAGVGIHEITYLFNSSEGCVDSILRKIEVYATTEIQLPATVFVLTGGKRVIPASITSPNSTYKYRYKWSPSIGLSDDSIINPVTTPQKDTEYTLTVSIDGLCDVSEKVLVKVLEELRPPNSFSPNGDGINDFWSLSSLESYPDAEVMVFTRGGQRVFFSRGYATPFDGTFENRQLPVGVYYYRISPNNGQRTLSGSLTIIR